MRRPRILTMFAAAVMCFGTVVVLAPEAQAASCPGTSTRTLAPQTENSKVSCTLVTKDLGTVTGAVGLNAAVVVDDTVHGVDYTNFRSYLIGTLSCTRSGTVVFSTGAIRNIWHGVTAGVYPRGVLTATGHIICSLSAMQVTLGGYVPSSYTTSSISLPYINADPGGAGVSSPGPNGGGWDPNAHSWPVGTTKQQVIRTEWHGLENVGPFVAMSSTNMTSCSFASSDLATCGAVDSTKDSYVTVTLWAWQIKAPGDYTVCNAMHISQPVVISPETHHLTLPQYLTLNLKSSCDSTVVIKTEISVSHWAMYTAGGSTSVGGYYK